MSKQIDNIKKLKYKQNRLEGNSIKQSLILAGYKENTAKHSSTYGDNALGVVKCGEKEIREEFEAKSVTVELVLKNLFEDRELAKQKGDIATMTATDKLLGQYLVMFTDKIKSEIDIIENNEEFKRLRMDIFSPTVN